jgi:type I site-specific restriction-modification system R (restriction) subunit
MVIKSSDVFGDSISTYTRVQALDDGVLVDVSKEAKHAGFRLPIAVTEAVWQNYIEWSDEDTSNQTIQDSAGRLWDVLWMFRQAINTSKDSNQVIYQLNLVPRDGITKKPRLTKLKGVICGGDNGEPVITDL